MRLATFRPPGSAEAIAGEVIDDRVHAFTEDGLAGHMPTRSMRSWPVSDVELLAPIPDPGTIYAIGLNYAAHLAETGATQPEEPLVFVKVRGSVAPPGGPIRCPEVVRRLDYEGE